MINLFNKKAVTLTLSGVLAFAVLNLTSCKKQDDADASSAKSGVGAEKAKEAYKKAPRIDVLNGDEKFSTPDGVTYSNAGEFSFSSTSNVEISASSNITFSQEADGSVIAVSPSGSGSGGGGGTVQAGKTNLSIDYAFCLSANDEGLGFDADFMELGFDGLSFVVGIDGDFSGDAENPEDILNGMAIYYVFDDAPNGNFDVFNFAEVEDSEDPEADFKGKALAFVWDFENTRIYISSSGSLSVSGGSITFTGTYYEFDLDLFGEDEDASFKEVNGLGTMGCE